MAGVKGAGGPIPKRSTQRRNKTKPAIPEETAPAVVSTEAPPADKSWAQPAIEWYESLSKSGQSQWYAPSDWQQARVLAAVLSKIILAEEMNGALLGQWLRGAAELMTTEGARRRLRIELQPLTPKSGDDGGSDVARIDDYRRRLESG